ncbi:MAG TPA: tetratricopeptide repeat protein, partial [Myxococcota bacterium]
IGGAVLLRLRRRGAHTSGLVAVASLIVTSLVWFALPAALTLQGSLIYAGGAAALVHCAQYLWITSFVEGRLALVQARRFDAVAWTATVVGLGVVLFTIAPWVASRVLGYDLIISLLIVQAVVNLHHFVVDAFVWKWRDPAVSGPVFSGHDFAPAQREQVSNIAAMTATVAVVALVVVAVVDVSQLVGTRSDASDEARDRALWQNPNDSRLLVQEAQRALQAGDVDGARAALGKAIALSPYNADAQRALVRLHVVEGRLEDAWSRRQDAPAGLLDTPDNDVVFADIALRTQRLDDAERLARRALDHAGLNSAIAVEARRVLGTVLLTQGKAGEARPLLRAALDDGEVLLGGGDVVGEGQLLDLALALARSEIAIKQADPALLLLQRVFTGAVKADRADVAVEALLAQADVFVAREQAREALEHLQRALRIAEEARATVDVEHVARAWLDYGGLLARSDAPMRARYTCALKARRFAELMKAGPKQDELLKFINEATIFVEEVLSAEEREATRKDVDAAAREALSLAYPDDAVAPKPAAPTGQQPDPEGQIITIPPAP